MKKFLCALMALACVCGCKPSSDTDTNSTTTSCSCDCPDGPPAPPVLDQFCVQEVHAGAACCRPEGGVCQNHECAVMQPQVMAFLGSTACFEPTSCAMTEADLKKLCSTMFPLQPVPVVCSAVPKEAWETDGRRCTFADYQPRCAWDDAVYQVICCEGAF